MADKLSPTEEQLMEIIWSHEHIFYERDIAGL